MNEIICPHCSKAFKIDEAGYANILKQVRDGDFDKQLHERLELAEREKRDAIALAEAKIANALQSAAARKDAEIQALQAQLAAGEVARKLAVTEALGAVSKERDGLANQRSAKWRASCLSLPTWHSSACPTFHRARNSAPASDARSWGARPARGAGWFLAPCPPRPFVTVGRSQRIAFDRAGSHDYLGEVLQRDRFIHCDMV